MPKKKAVLYEDLRSKNRENYEVTLTQKAETLLKPQAGVASPKREGEILQSVYLKGFFYELYKDISTSHLYSGGKK